MRRDLVLAILLACLLTYLAALAQAESWPGWRGPRGDGTCVEQGIPTNWDPARALWKTEIPGQGHASAIVWGDRVCTVTGLPARKERVLLCLDRTSGKVLWQQTVVQGPLENINKENSYASGTPATDGERVYVVFRVGERYRRGRPRPSQRQTALAGPSGDAYRRVGIQQ